MAREPGHVLCPPLAELEQSTDRVGPVPAARTATLQDFEREHILAVPGQTHWVVGVSTGAALSSLRTGRNGG